MSHIAYVTAAYLGAALTIVGLALWILLDQRARRRELKDLEARGIRRRAQRTDGKP